MCGGFILKAAVASSTPVLTICSWSLPPLALSLFPVHSLGSPIKIKVKSPKKKTKKQRTQSFLYAIQASVDRLKLRGVTVKIFCHPSSLQLFPSAVRLKLQYDKNILFNTNFDLIPFPTSYEFFSLTHTKRGKKTTMMLSNTNFAKSIHTHAAVWQYVAIVAVIQYTYSVSLEQASASYSLLMILSFHRSRVLGLKELLNKHLSVQVSCMHTSLKGYMQAEIRATSFHCCWNRSCTDVEAPLIIGNIPSV